MEKFLIYILAGFTGGIIRGLVGFVKNKTIEKANHFKPKYFLITIAIYGIVGAVAGILADTEWQVSFLAGYAFMSSISFVMVVVLMRRRIFCLPLTVFQNRINSSYDLSFQTPYTPQF